MRRLISAIALAALCSAPAMADPAAVGDSSVWHIGATIGGYCSLDKTDADSPATLSGTNASVSLTTAGDASDGNVAIQTLVSPTGSQMAWSATITLNKSYCSQGFSVTARSQNGGLLNAKATGTGAFTTLLDYNIGVKFGGANGTIKASSALAGAKEVVNNPTAAAGPFELDFTSIENAKGLLLGDYNDTVTITISPV